MESAFTAYAANNSKNVRVYCLNLSLSRTHETPPESGELAQLLAAEGYPVKRSGDGCGGDDAPVISVTAPRTTPDGSVLVTVWREWGSYEIFQLVQTPEGWRVAKVVEEGNDM